MIKGQGLTRRLKDKTSLWFKYKL